MSRVPVVSNSDLETLVPRGGNAYAYSLASSHDDGGDAGFEHAGSGGKDGGRGARVRGAMLRTRAVGSARQYVALLVLSTFFGPIPLVLWALVSSRALSLSHVYGGLTGMLVMCAVLMVSLGVGEHDTSLVDASVFVLLFVGVLGLVYHFHRRRALAQLRSEGVVVPGPPQGNLGDIVIGIVLQSALSIFALLFLLGTEAPRRRSIAITVTGCIQAVSAMGAVGASLDASSQTEALVLIPVMALVVMQLVVDVVLLVSTCCTSARTPPEDVEL